MNHEETLIELNVIEKDCDGSMVYCTKCGEKLPEEANFCPKCGVRTPRGRETNAPFPVENLREALASAGKEVEKAFQIALKEIEKAFKEAQEEIKKATG
ncbi:MAG: zinc ribbon domain-containing protein [Candidatus Bathyarchaeia archaeon]